MGYGEKENRLWRSDTATTLADMVGICYLRYFNNIGGLYIIQNGKKACAAVQCFAFARTGKAKADELNHTKLQFFTNITHELLTPLTIFRQRSMS